MESSGSTTAYCKKMEPLHDEPVSQLYNNKLQIDFIPLSF